MKIEHIETAGWMTAVRGMRNPMNSWDKNDSFMMGLNNEKPVLGPNDLDLAKRLCHAGSEHRKFMRQIYVSFDLTAPLYFWKEFDTYKIGTTANSTSTMHKLASTPITIDCFEIDDMEEGLEIDVWESWKSLIRTCETLRLKYNETKDIRYWKELIRILPESWLQTRTVTCNYEVVRNMAHQRANHKLTEWKFLLKALEENLPYYNELILDK
jgi:hypothetical protein